MYEYTLFQKKKKTVYRLISFAKEYKIEISKDSLTSLVIYLKKKKKFLISIQLSRNFKRIQYERLKKNIRNIPLPPLFLTSKL